MKKALLLTAALMGALALNAQTGYYTLDQINNDTDHALEASTPENGYWYQSGETVELNTETHSTVDEWTAGDKKGIYYIPQFKYSMTWRQTSHTNYLIKKIRVWREMTDHAEELASRAVRDVDDYLCYEATDVQEIEYGAPQVSDAVVPTPRTFCEAQGIADDGIGDPETQFGGRKPTPTDPVTIVYRLRVYTAYVDYADPNIYYENHGGIYTTSETPFRVWETFETVTLTNPTAVEELNVNRVETGKAYYNLQGMQSSEPFDGLNIVVTSYSDGTTSTSKVMR